VLFIFNENLVLILFLKSKALDAYCLVEIFDYFLIRLNEYKISFDFTKAFGKKFKNIQQSNNQKKSKDASKKKEENPNKIEHHVKRKNQRFIANYCVFIYNISFSEKDSNYIINETQIKPHELRLVCDNMLAGLGKELRRCGVDTVILDNDKDHTEVARVRIKLF
jgi:hypothetical protein